MHFGTVPEQCTGQGVDLVNMSLRIATRWLAGACLGGLLASSIVHAEQEIDPPGRVARINLAEGPVSVEPSGSNSWTDAVVNRPLTQGDRVWADQNARAELHVGSTAVRLGAETGITLGILDDRTVRLQLSAGSLQFRVRGLGPDETFEVATPFATVAILTPGNYRLDVSPRGDELHVIVTQGQAAVTDRSGAVTVNAGYDTLFRGAVAAAESERMRSGDALDRWAEERDRREDRAATTRYVSREVIGYEDLDDYGTWRVVDDYGPLWYPSVSAGWSPYRQGHWIWMTPWGWTWVDDAPWGFAPFHYGRWMNLGGAWAWTPGPRHGRPYYAPALVGWIGGFGVGVAVGGPPVAWFPLGWNEIYVPSYRASRGYVQTINVTNIHVNNVVVNEYYDRARGNAGQRDGRDRESHPNEYRNYGVAGAVVSTTRSAFAAGQTVNAHPAEIPHYERPRIDLAAPNVAPTPSSYGRPAVRMPRQELFTRPVMGGGSYQENQTVGARPEVPFRPSRGVEERPVIAAPNSVMPDPRPAVRAPTLQTPATSYPSPRSESRPIQEAAPRQPDYRPATNPPAMPTPEMRYPSPRSEARPASAAPPTPEYRSTGPAPDAPAPENRYSPPRNEWHPAPEAAPVPERRYEAPRQPDYHPAPVETRQAPPPMPREYRAPPPPPAAPPPAAAAPVAHPQASPPPKDRDDRRDRPH